MGAPFSPAETPGIKTKNDKTKEEAQLADVPKENLNE
jgi:hypothetical protein